MEYELKKTQNLVYTGIVNKVNGFVLDRFNAWGWWALALVAYAGSRMTQVWLDASYVASGFPVPFYVGQMTFDAAELKSYYAHMIEAGTLDVYVYTQSIDFVFMATALVSLFLLGVAALRTIPKAVRKGKVLKVALFVMWVTPFAAGLDALENFISFAMLGDPTEFADWLVYPYSGLAAAKFSMFAMNYLWLLTVLVGTMGYGLGQLVGRFAKPRPKVV